MKNFEARYLLLLFFSIIFSVNAGGYVTDAVCKKAGGRIESGSGTCNKSCNYYRTLYKNHETSMRCSRDYVPSCICPTNECFENGKCKALPKKMRSFFMKKTSQQVDMMKDVKTLCTKAGGTWRMFPDACGNSCTKARNPGIMCASVMTKSCDCGENKCFDSDGTCVNK